MKDKREQENKERELTTIITSVKNFNCLVINEVKLYKKYFAQLKKPYNAFSNLKFNK